MSKKTLSKIILIAFIFWITNISFAEDSNYTIYQNRIKNICEEKSTVDNKYLYKPDWEVSSLLKNETVYENPDSKSGTWNEQASTRTWISEWFDAPFIKAKWTYKTNMNNMYKCALLKIQIKELQNIQKLIKVDTTWEILKSIDQKINQKIMKLQTLAIDWRGSGSCTNTDKNKEFDKKEVLQNVTYETCKYVTYLDFLRSYYTNTQNLLQKDTAKDTSIINKWLQAINWVSSIDSIRATYNKIWIDINREEKHAIETFPVAFQSYNEYAYNFPLHVLLQIVKEDLIIFRDKLNAVLNPINQVVYKISNAQKD
jgi:hypothetical protein